MLYTRNQWRMLYSRRSTFAFPHVEFQTPDRGEFHGHPAGRGKKHMKRTRTPTERSMPGLPPLAPVARVSAPGGETNACPETNVPVLLLGGRRDCAVPIMHGDVSQIHAAIVNTGQALIVVDLASRAGTFVNEVRITAAALRPGDRLRLGPVPVSVQYKTPPLNNTGDPTRLASPLTLKWKESEFKIDSLPVVIGRRQACVVLVDTPDVSLAHALLLRINGCLAVMDLGSRSGTFVGGERVGFAWLRDGDDLGVGGEHLSIRWQGPVSPDAQTARFACTNAPVAEVAAPRAVAPATPATRTPVGRPFAAAPAHLEASQSAPVVQLVNAEMSTPDGAEAALDGHLNEIESRARGLRGAVAARMQYLATRAEQLSAKFADQERQSANLATERELLRNRATELEKWEAKLRALEHELAQREAATAEAARRVEEVRGVLDLASRSLGGLDNGSPRGAPARTPPEPQRCETPPRNVPSPAPIIDRPLFGAIPGGVNV